MLGKEVPTSFLPRGEIAQLLVLVQSMARDSQIQDFLAHFGLMFGGLKYEKGNISKMVKHEMSNSKNGM